MGALLHELQACRRKRDEPCKDRSARQELVPGGSTGTQRFPRRYGLLGNDFQRLYQVEWGLRYLGSPGCRMSCRVFAVSMRPLYGPRFRFMSHLHASTIAGKACNRIMPCR